MWILFLYYPFLGKDVIPEESEIEEFDDGEKSYVTDSCIGEEEQEHVGSFDENSLAFERDLDRHPEEGKRAISIKMVLASKSVLDIHYSPIW